MKKYLFFLTLLPMLMFTACGSDKTEDEIIKKEEPTNRLIGRNFKEIVALPFTNDYNTDGKEVEDFKKYISWQAFLKGKYVEHEKTKDSLVNYIISVNGEYNLSFTDKDNCVLNFSETARYSTKKYSVYTYECELPHTDFRLGTSFGVESLSPTLFFYRGNSFQLIYYAYKKEVFSEIETIETKESIYGDKKIDMTYTIDDNGNITFTNIETNEKYNGVIKDDVVYADFKIKGDGQNILR